jgi:ABC-type transport system involved in cytochrome bd biosynthesis fused ATPase/permease subunit
VLESRQLELLDHAVELRGLGAVSYGSNEIGAISDSEHKLALRAIRVALGSSLVTEFISGVSIGLVAMVVGFGLLNGTVQLEHALISVLVTSEIFTQVRRYGSEFHRRENAMQAIALLALDNPSPRSSSETSLLKATELVTKASSVPFDVVITPGSRLLITGASGSGKTSLLHTLLGWLAPVDGGVELSAERIGFVSPSSGLLSGSLYENLALGESHDRGKVARLLSDLGLDEERFADLDGLLLADGQGISSGEKVRLVLARSLLANPQLLLIDDIAGLLDEESKQKLQNVLSQRSDIAIIEATVDNPVIENATTRFEVRS